MTDSWKCFFSEYLQEKVRTAAHLEKLSREMLVAQRIADALLQNQGGRSAFSGKGSE